MSNSLTPWNAVHQAPLSFTVSHGLLKLMSIELVMLSNHHIYWFNYKCTTYKLCSGPFSHKGRVIIIFHNICSRNYKLSSKTNFPMIIEALIFDRDAAAAAAAKSSQSCPTLCDLIDGSPPGSPVPGILQARTLEWVAISLSNAWKWKVKVKSLSCVQLLATSWTAAYQAPPSMGFSRQKY